MGLQTLELRIEESLATILLNRPQALSAINLAIKGPLAVRAAKEAIEDGCDMALERALAHEAQLFALCFATEDRAEGVNAFLEKRPPNFKGK